MSGEAAGRYEAVIGLEVHVQLKTRTKLFCGCAVAYGGPPNARTCPVCLGLPGALPVANAKALELAIRAGLATHCQIHLGSIYARKNYFYPDLPKGYQISQYEEPLASGGYLDVEGDGETTRRVGITRIHMEDDAGKSIHDAAALASEESRMDFNRCGIPLIEIVSEPDLRSVAEAGDYLRALRQVIRYAGVSDADMEKGQFRCDANVSLRDEGASELGTRTETKNLNSFRFVEQALSVEIERQAQILLEGGRVVQQTMLFDAESGTTRVMRVKENADDYRYFPDPDLLPLRVDESTVARLRRELPELPDERRARFRREYALSEYDARLLTASRSLADYFEKAAADSTPKAVSNWLLNDVLRWLGERGADAEAIALAPAGLASLIGLVEAGRVTAASARQLLPELLDAGGDPELLVRERGLEALSDSGVLEEAIDQVIAAHPEQVEKLRAGETKLLNFLMGQVMQRTRGKASPAVVRELLARKLAD